MRWEEIKNLIVAGLTSALYYRFIVPSVGLGIKIAATVLAFFAVLLLVDFIDQKVSEKRIKKVLDKIMKEIDEKFEKNAEQEKSA